MNKFCFVIAVLAASINVAAQAPLDLYNSFPTTDEPEGWTYNLNINSGDLFYYGGSDNNPSLRLDATGEYAMVEISESPGSLSYYVRSTGFSPPVSPGTEFEVQESVDGMSWNTLRVLDANNLDGDFTFFADTPDPMAHYFRFYYTNKASGSNIALDEVTITKAPAGPDARLMVHRDDEKIISGHSVTFSGEENLLLELENEGLEETLEINNVTITGPDAAAFMSIPAPTSVAPGESDFFQVNVIGEVGAVYEAQLQLMTNDAYNPTYTINLIGHGGEFASEPESNPTDFEVENIRTYGFDFSWSHPDVQPERYLILQSTSSAANEVPEDGEEYDVSEYIGDSRVVYNGSGSAFNPRDIGAATTYSYAIYSYNGAGDYTNYQETNPLTGYVTTPDNMIGDYYDGLNSQQPSFVIALSDVIFPHDQLDYLDYPSTLIDEFEARDTTEQRKVVTGYYTGYEYLYQDPFGWDVLSREHVFAHSWFATYQAFDEVEYTDYHNLFPVHNDSANMPRLNHPFGIVESEVLTYLQGKLGYNLDGNLVYEPRDFAKGRAARAVFYMLATYNQQIGGDWQLPFSQDQQLLKDWHFEYLPDSREIARNDYIHSIQNNRNPFIDSVYFACYIDFETMTYLPDPESWCVSVSVDDEEGDQPVLYPNPSSGDFKIRWSAPTNSAVALGIYDNSGRMVWSEDLPSGQQEFLIIPKKLPSGFYRVQWQKDGRSGQWPLVIRP